MDANTLPPGPTTGARLAGLTMLRDWVQHPYSTQTQLRETYGPRFTLTLPGMGTIVEFCTPAAVEAVVRGTYGAFHPNNAAIDFALGPHSVFLLQDQQHARARKLFSGPLRGERMRSYGPAIQEIADGELDRVAAMAAAGRPVTLMEAFHNIALRVIIRCVFGVSEPTRLARYEQVIGEYVPALFEAWVALSRNLMAPGRLGEMLDTLADRSRAREGFPALLAKLPLLKQGELRGRFDALLFEDIEHAQARARAQERGEDKARGEDILSLLAAARDEQGVEPSREELRDQLVTMLIAGHESTAASLGWAAHCLIERPELAQRLRAELAEIMGPGQGFDHGRARELALLTSVINESMRLYPSIGSIGRLLERATTVDGVDIPAGVGVGLPIYAIHRDPAFYDQPDRFDPERFLKRGPSPYKFLPFGCGLWRCVGAAFATSEIRVAMARLLQRFELAPGDGSAMEPITRGFVVMPARGLPVRLSPL